MPSKTETPKEFYDSVDWEAWYHEFVTATTRGGKPKYASIFAFAQDKAAGSRMRRDTILYVVGPVVNKSGSGTPPAYADLEQFDWDKRRKAGFWLGPETLKDQIARITQDTDTILALKKAGQEFLLPLMAQTVAMMEKIEASFSGQLFMPGLSDKANEARAVLWMRLTQHVNDNIIRLQEAYARAMMLNNGDMLGTIAVREHIASTIDSADEKQRNGTLGKILDMMADKGAAMKLPLPDADIGRVVNQEKMSA